MSVHRAILFAITALFTAGMTSIASAGCCDWGASAPIAYAPTGCGGGCGTPTAAIIYAQPVAPRPRRSSSAHGLQVGAPVAAASVRSFTRRRRWRRRRSRRRRSTWSIKVRNMPAPASWSRTGPGRRPRPTHASSAYPYVPGYGYGYGTPAYYPHHVYGRSAPRMAYRERVFAHPRYYGPHYYGPMPRWRPYPHRPLGVRG